jgi:hypothetical protein
MNPTIDMNAPMIASLNAGDNTYGAGANGITILEDVLTTPNGITMNSVGIAYNNGTTTTTTSWDTLSNKIAYLSAVAPNGLNASLLAVNDAISIQNADTTPTRVINTQAGDTAVVGEHFGIAWVGNTLPFVMETLDATPLQVKDTQLKLTSSTTGGSANPILTLTNTNADSSSVALEVFKDKGVAPTNGDVLFQQSVYGEDSFLNKQEYTRITHTIRDITGGAEDGSIEMGCFVNGSFANFLQLNGNQNEINCLKPLDMDGHNIRTSTGNLTIDTTGSSGSGNITIAGKSAGITNINATTIGITASSILTMSATGAGAYISATANDDISLTSSFGDVVLNATAGICKVNAPLLYLNNVNIIPRSSYNTGSFSVMGTPTTNIVNFGAPIDMTATTIWKVEVGFYTGAINTRNVLTYLAYDTTNTDCVQSSVFGYANGGLQTAIQYDPAGTPMGTYCSFVDTFQISIGAVGACSFVLAGGTADSSTWSGTYRTSIILTRLV